jgi:16S rRNA (adenine1518-N6/adenine1519-N6)-dimethyltransferase
VRPRRAAPKERSRTTRHRPRKRFAQHFLAPQWAAKLVSALRVEPGDLFFEIGPGTGALTLPLAATGTRVLAIDIDRDLVSALAERAPANVTVLTGDALSADFIPMLRGLEPQRPFGDPGAAAGPPRFRIVGNLPYNVASPLLARMTTLQAEHALFHDATVMVQREVADRLLARPGTKDYGVLTIMMALHTRITRLFDLPPGAFTPPPKVRSSVIRLVFDPLRVRLSDPPAFERLVKALFGQRRKTLANALKKMTARPALVAAEAGLDGRRRPETLQLEELARLAESLAREKRAAVL